MSTTPNDNLERLIRIEIDLQTLKAKLDAVERDIGIIKDLPRQLMMMGIKAAVTTAVTVLIGSILYTVIKQQ